MSEMLPTAATRSGGAFPSRRTTLIVLSILTLPYILGLIVAAFFAFVSPLVFDAPGSTDDPLAWAGFLVFCTSPVAFILALVGGWLSFYMKRYRLAFILALLPLLEGIVLLIAGAVVEGLS